MTESLADINKFLDVAFAFGPFWVYAVIFVACFIENIVPPFPGDTFIVAAGALVAVDRLEVVPAMLAVMIGGLVSVMMLHRFGWTRGRDFFIKRDFKYFSAEDIKKMEIKFRKYGAWIILGSRFVMGVRSSLTVVAGISRYNAVPMLLFSAVSYLLFGGLLMLAGIKLVENLERIEYYFKTYNAIVWPLIVALVGFWMWRKISAARSKRSE